MSFETRSFFTAGLIAGAVALGCQAPPALVPGTPRVVVRGEAMGLAPTAPLSVVLERTCPEGGDEFALQQASGTLDPHIARIEVRVSGPGLIEDLMIPVTPADFGSRCWWVSDYYDLPPGNYHVVFTAYDAIGDVIASAQGDETVDPSNPSTIKLQCDFSSGGIVVCVGPCPPSPTGSPTPASPTPMPSQLPLAGVFERIHGLHADNDGNVYLFGLKPKPWPDDYHIGRIVEVAPGGAWRLLEPAKFQGKDFVLYEGDVAVASQGGYDAMNAFLGLPPKLWPSGREAWSSNSSLVKLRDGSQYVAYTINHARGDFLRPWGASVGVAGQIIAGGASDPTKAASYSIEGGSKRFWVDRRHLVGDRRAAIERPLSMTIRLGKWPAKYPVWTCKRGILTIGDSATAEPQVLVSRPAYAITRVVDSRNDVLFTTYEDGDTRVYFADLTAGTPPTFAYTFKVGAPHRIERGADGAFYVLIAETPLPFDAASGDPYMYEFPGKKEVRVVKMRFDAASRKLVQPELIVDTFQDPTPSW